MKKDIIVIGGGVVGCAVARLLSAYQADIAVVEGGSDVAEGASKANSGIVHAGFDAKPSSVKAKLNVLGAKMYPELCAQLGVPYKKSGALVLAFAEDGREVVENLLKQGTENGVQELRIVEKEEILALEPNVNPDVVCGLLVPTSGITSPYELTYAFADHAAVNGVAFMLDTYVDDISVNEDGFTLATSKGNMQARIIINCAGLHSAKLHNMISDEKLTIIPRKGEYYLLDRQGHMQFNRTIFQTPTKMGKGVLITPTVHGNMLMGPTAIDVDDDTDVSTTAEALSRVTEAIGITWPMRSTRTVITTFAGIRAHEINDDFIVGAVNGVPGAYETVGIESPGLTAAPAIAQVLAEQIAKEHSLEKKPTWNSAPKHAKPFSEMTIQEKMAAVKADPEYGAIVCRCEQVTEAEIRAAIKRPVGARSIDAIKRRTRAGMGRCQGGFCSPRVLEILAQELNIDPMQVTKNGGESRLLVGSIADAAHKEDA